MNKGNSILCKIFKLKNMIKVVDTLGNVFFLSESAFALIRYCKSENVLLVYSTASSENPEITLANIQSINDVMVETIYQSSKKDYHSDPIEVILKWVKAREFYVIHHRIEVAIDSAGINTVGDLVDIKRKGFSKCKNIGKVSMDALSRALKELYGINW